MGQTTARECSRGWRLLQIAVSVTVEEGLMRDPVAPMPFLAITMVETATLQPNVLAP